MNKKNVIRISILTFLVTLLSACGFHLRGQVDLPVGLRILNLDAQAAETMTQNLLRQSMLSNGITLSQDAPYTLKIISESGNRRVLSVTSNAKASEYELTQNLSFKLLDANGEAVSEELNITSYRTLQYDADAEIGKAQEEANLRREMKQNNAYNVLIRLKAIKLPKNKAN
ncbi:LPS assembly lipoprotein LptE [Bermanella sp. WJH001]|uniref:LPS-assembly lipoprotein LptE n=1 Tax=Bermanella sp. WJH001 TaxID=3048005 RepID=UPI0024BF0AB8|nr:LPS assembly lipoprotein LptE [Bermanella sp. WJH001]MDJ1538470.1 LPS assembly lipoprotein LptE [Bermanella sp. WJH001]